jgi:hypothetical protein
MPFVSPTTVQLVAPLVEQVSPPGLAVAVYEVIGLPPSDAGGDHDRATWPSSGVPEFRVGAPGTVVGAVGVALTSADWGPSPTALTALTV